MELDELS